MVQPYRFNDSDCPEVCKQGITRVSNYKIKSKGDEIGLIS